MRGVVIEQVAARFSSGLEACGHCFGKGRASQCRGIRVEESKEEDTAGKIDQEVRRLIDESYREGQALLKKNRKQLEEGSNMLLEKETITPEDFPALLQAA